MGPPGKHLYVVAVAVVLLETEAIVFGQQAGVKSVAKLANVSYVG